jgi:hypothetical protein
MGRHAKFDSIDVIGVGFENNPILALLQASGVLVRRCNHQLVAGIGYRSCPICKKKLTKTGGVR